MALCTKHGKTLLLTSLSRHTTTTRGSKLTPATFGEVASASGLSSASSKLSESRIAPQICSRQISSTSSSSCLNNVLGGYSVAQSRTSLTHDYADSTRRLLSRRYASSHQDEDFSKGYGGPIRTPVIDWRDRHTINYKTFAKMVENREKTGGLLIDVRETFELTSAGGIDDSVNIPYVNFRSALMLNDEEFTDKFGAKKPNKSDDNIVLIDLRGNRSEGALRICHELGFTKVVRFPGGFQEWSEKNHLPNPPTYYEHGVPRDHWTNLKYDDLRMMIKRDDVVVIDVREPWEVVEQGAITNAFNIPVGYLEFALDLSESDFEKQYGRRKPGKMDDIGFISWKGLRSAACQLLAQELGYKKACHFRGGMDKYNLKRKEAERPWARAFPIPRDTTTATV